MPPGIKWPNLITGLIVTLLLLLLSFLGGIYGTIKHRQRSKKLRLQSIVKHDLAAAEARMAVLNVERERRLEEQQQRQEKKGVKKGGDKDEAEDLEKGAARGRNRDKLVHGEKDGVDALYVIEGSSGMISEVKHVDTELGQLRVRLNSVDIDPETGRAIAQPELIKHKPVKLKADTAEKHIEIQTTKRPSDEELGGDERAKRSRWSVFSREGFGG